MWPEGFEETFCTDPMRCRFKPVHGTKMGSTTVIGLLQPAANTGIDVLKTENLYSFNGIPAFSLGHGQ